MLDRFHFLLTVEREVAASVVFCSESSTPVAVPFVELPLSPFKVEKEILTSYRCLHSTETRECFLYTQEHLVRQKGDAALSFLSAFLTLKPTLSILACGTPL